VERMLRELQHEKAILDRTARHPTAPQN
jgi:hypothetical protein